MDGSSSANLKFYCFIFLEEPKSPRCKASESAKGKSLAPANSNLGIAMASGVELSKEKIEIDFSRTDEGRQVRKIPSAEMTFGNVEFV